MKNFTRPKNEKPYYYASSIVKGRVVQHEGNEKFAMYKSEMKETNRRANKYHKWLDKNYKNNCNDFGILNTDIYLATTKIRNQFMNGTI